ncbi:lytic transglycosylase domain-containing protein [soil metagenome]
MTVSFSRLRFTAATLALLAGTAAASFAHAGAAPQDPAQALPRPYVQTFGFQTEATAPAIGPLSDSDARTYAAAFDAIKKGQFALADSIGGAVQDACLAGRLQYAKLMHSAYKATYGELKTWLDAYRDQPGADRVFVMAKKRRLTEAAASEDAIGAMAADDGPSAPVSSADPRIQQSKEAFYAGDVNTGYALATASGERWVAGLAAFRLGKFEESYRWLSDLAQDEAQNEWVRSGAAWWAARSAATAGLTEEAAPYLKLAASTPYTFYGLIAAHQLGLDTPTTLAPSGEVSPLAPQAFQRVADAQGKLGPSLAELVQTDARARRAAALAQAGMRVEAGAELRTALLGSGDVQERKTWRTLAATLNAPLTPPDELRRSAAHRFDPSKFDAPEFAPKGGYTLEKALVDASVKQESGFNAGAVSPAGAYGLMQLMPATAALVKGDVRRPVPAATLLKPAENLRLGQDYVARILTSVNGDLIRAVASYNSGPGTILKTAARLGDDADSLLLIESMPGADTREYVERVMSNYWIYRKLWGLASPTLDAVASGRSKIPAILDANRGQGAKFAKAD